jgi:hydrogenase maturation protease
MRRRIICIGNRFVEEDAAGPAVYECLRQKQLLPENIELIEGGLMGLDLLPYLEQGGRVVFVDAVKGYGKPGEIVVLDYRQIKDTFETSPFGHGAGLAYLLAVLPRVCEGEMPEEIVLLGLGGVTPHLIERAADLSIELALLGMKESGW